jgi:hypothetical protein
MILFKKNKKTEQYKCVPGTLRRMRKSKIFCKPDK